jgi:hypothetical protein
VYVGAFVGRAARTYFMVAPAAALCILMGYGLARVQGWLGARPLSRGLEWAWLPLAAGLVFGPAQSIISRSMRPNLILEAAAWIHANVPANTRIFHFGRRPYGAYLVANDRKLQARWGDHFEYGRSHYRFLRQAFESAFASYAKSGRPRYVIEMRDESPRARRTKQNKRWLTDGLLRRARERKQKYIILYGYRERDVRELGYPWFGDAVLEQQFGDVAIFRVPDAAPVAPAALSGESAAPAPAPAPAR